MSNVLRVIAEYKGEIARLRKENYELKLEIGRLIEEINILRRNQK